MRNKLQWNFNPNTHDDVIKWKRFPRNWPFVRGIHRSPVNSPHKGQWRGALMFSLICVWINDWVNNREAGDLRRHRGHYDVIVMKCFLWRRCIGKCYLLNGSNVFRPYCIKNERQLLYLRKFELRGMNTAIINPLVDIILNFVCQILWVTSDLSSHDNHGTSLLCAGAIDTSSATTWI